MKELGLADRQQIVTALAKGNSLRAITRMTGVARNTVNKLLLDLGRACSKYQDQTFRKLRCNRIECDEIWTLCGTKEKKGSAGKKAERWGDVWTWVALDPDTKLVPTWFVGTRDASVAYHFINDLAERLASAVHLTTHGHRAYLQAVGDAFSADIDFGKLVRIYGNQPRAHMAAEVDYGLARCIGARHGFVTGEPSFQPIPTNRAQRRDLSVRMRTFTNGCSKKVENHENALAFHFMSYNFGHIHPSLRVTPAMEAGISDHVWSIEEILSLLDSKAASSEQRGVRAHPDD